jgi:hypothetical protein
VHDSDESSSKVLFGYGIAKANGCFYHDIFAATIVSARSCLQQQSWFSVDSCTVASEQHQTKFYRNKFSLSSLVNNQNESSRY